MFAAPLRMNLVSPLNGIRRVSDSRKTKKNRKTGLFLFILVRVINAHTSTSSDIHTTKLDRTWTGRQRHRKIHNERQCERDECPIRECIQVHKWHYVPSRADDNRVRHNSLFNGRIGCDDSDDRKMCTYCGRATVPTVETFFRMEKVFVACIAGNLNLLLIVPADCISNINADPTENLSQKITTCNSLPMRSAAGSSYCAEW